MWEQRVVLIKELTDQTTIIGKTVLWVTKISSFAAHIHEHHLYSCTTKMKTTEDACKRSKYLQTDGILTSVRLTIHISIRKITQVCLATENVAKDLLKWPSVQLHYPFWNLCEREDCTWHARNNRLKFLCIAHVMEIINHIPLHSHVGTLLPNNHHHLCMEHVIACQPYPLPSFGWDHEIDHNNSHEEHAWLLLSTKHIITTIHTHLMSHFGTDCSRSEHVLDVPWMCQQLVAWIQTDNDVTE